MQYVHTGKLNTNKLTLIEKLELLRFLKMFKLDDAFSMVESGTRDIIKHHNIKLNKCLVALEVTKTLSLPGIEKALLRRITGRFEEMTKADFEDDIKAIKQITFEKIMKKKVQGYRQYIYRYRK